MNTFLWIAWFVSGFISMLFLNWTIQREDLSWGNILESLLLSFSGPLVLAVLLIMIAVEKLGEIPVFKRKSTHDK